MSNFQNLDKAVQELAAFIDILNQQSEPDTDLLNEANSIFATFSLDVDKLETQSLLSGPHDTLDCFFSLNSGAGGTDAQDWTEILLRMYTRWFDSKGFNYELLDQTMGDEAGIKSVTLSVKGTYVYGLLKNEIGVHRLVRISPFNANGKRQTSFAAVDVIPEFQNETQKLDIDPKDLRVDTFRSSGAGGQHVNKTDSAVRITHIPTGLVAQSQNSRSQISNRETALNILKARIMQRLIREQKQKIEDLRGEVTDNAWGSQIRSYVFHPYKLVKDLRTNYETSDLADVIDGNLDPFIQHNLQNQQKKQYD